MVLAGLNLGFLNLQVIINVTLKVTFAIAPIEGTEWTIFKIIALLGYQLAGSKCSYYLRFIIWEVIDKLS